MQKKREETGVYETEKLSEEVSEEIQNNKEADEIEAFKRYLQEE